MILSMSEQAWLFILNIGLGFLIGFIFDVFRIIRKLFRHPNFLTNIEDIIYWLIVSFIVFCFMLNKNYGEIRIFSIIGTLLGKLVYFLTISPIVLKVSLVIIRFVAKIVSKTIFFILLPIKLVIKIILIPIKWIYSLIKPPIKKIYNPCKKVLRSAKNYAKMKKKAIKKDIKIFLKRI